MVVYSLTKQELQAIFDLLKHQEVLRKKLEYNMYNADTMEFKKYTQKQIDYLDMAKTKLINYLAE